MENEPTEVVRVRAPIGERVAENIRLLRGRRGMDQKDLSARLAVLGRPIAVSGISKIEKKQRRVDPDDLVALAIALGVNPSALLLEAVGGDEDMSLAPAYARPAWSVWQWADGYMPLPTRDADEGYNSDDEVADFQQFARPGLLSRAAQHPLMRAANSMRQRAERMVAGKVTPAFLTMAKRDLERMRIELEEMESRVEDQ